MFSGEAKSDFPKLPTIRQYCKSSPEFPPTKCFVIEKIWLPNQFPSLSFVTEVFLLRISTGEAIYQPLRLAIEEWEKESKTPIIRIPDKAKATWEIDLLENESSTWEQMGEFGLKLTVNERKGNKRKSK